MLGNPQVRFLGGLGLATTPGYPMFENRIGMKISVHYYSGAGNTEFLAKKIAKSFKNNSCSVHINRITDYSIQNIRDDFDILGIGFPIYFREAPELIYDFLKKLDGKGRPIFFFATKGLYSGNTVKNTMTFAVAHNFQPVGSIEFYMPGTDFLILFARKNSLVEKILKFIHCRNFDKRTNIFREKLQGLSPAKIPLKKWYTFFDDYIVKKLEKIYDNHHKDCIEKFYAKPDICVECMKCIKECPKNNITFDKHIKFGTRCDVCFRCINLCPVESIQIGNITEGHVRYNKVELK